MPEIPILDLALAEDPATRPQLLVQLHHALFNIGFLYIKNHGIPQPTLDALSDILPRAFSVPTAEKLKIAKLNSPHFLGYNGLAEETTLGQKDLREQFDYATELPVIYDADFKSNGHNGVRDFSKLYWRLRGPNQWLSEELLPGFRDIVTRYHDALAELSYRFVHLIEEAFGIPVGTFDQFFVNSTPHFHSSTSPSSSSSNPSLQPTLPPQHRLKLLHYPPVAAPESSHQGVGPHKDSSGWLTFLYQPPHPEGGLHVLCPTQTHHASSVATLPPLPATSTSPTETWLPAPPIPGTFVVNIGNAFEAATCSALRATIHKVDAPRTQPRYSVAFFMGLPLDLTVSGIRDLMPDRVKMMGRQKESMEAQTREAAGPATVSAFLDERWDGLGESQLRKWIRSHQQVGRKWYGDEVVAYHLS